AVESAKPDGRMGDGTSLFLPKTTCPLLPSPAALTTVPRGMSLQSQGGLWGDGPVLEDWEKDLGPPSGGGVSSPGP
ncbi:hypothetical protein A2U01_0101452, partial [Trifolium medium]|nr:hypothetical protein [Trifolium medium]